MVKFAPVLIEFGDGDTGYQIGLTEEGYGCIALFNAEPGEIGRTFEGDLPEDKIGAYIVFKNVESLDSVARNFRKLRDAMVTGRVETSNHIKSSWVCETCRWSVDNDCVKHECNGDCPNFNDDGNCKCCTVAEGDPCPYFEKFDKEGKL